MVDETIMCEHDVDNREERPSEKKLIIIPYADLSEAQSGANIGNITDRQELYYKLCCTALVSAAMHNGNETDVALVTNRQVPQKYKRILEMNNVLIFYKEFDNFRFQNDYKWCLAFYKLCAFKHVVDCCDYDFYAYLDSDVYIKGSFDNIWQECRYNIMLYDFNSGLNERFYRRFLGEVEDFTSNSGIVTHYGGEFCACSKENALILTKHMQEIFDRMYANGFVTLAGDEFILSLSANLLKERVKNAGAYVFRFWTGEYRIVTTAYKYNSNMCVLHCPQEKNRGLLKIFDRYIAVGKLPDINKVYRMLHLNRRRLRIVLGEIKAKLIGVVKH